MSNSVFITIFHPSAFDNRIKLAQKLISSKKFKIKILVLETCVTQNQISYLKKEKIHFILIKHSDKFLNYYLKNLNKVNYFFRLILIISYKIYLNINKSIFYFPFRFLEIYFSYRNLHKIIKNQDKVITSNLFWRVENILILKISKIKKIDIICIPHDLFTKDEEYHHLKINKSYFSFFYKYLFKKKWIYKNLLPSYFIEILALNILKGKIDYPWTPNNDAKLILTESRGNSNYLVSQGCKKLLIREIGSFDVNKKPKISKKFILIFLPPNQNPKTTKNFEYKSYLDLIEFIIIQVTRNNPTSKFILHPRSRYLKKTLKKKFKKIDLVDGNYMEYLPQARICITWHSSTIAKMLWMNKPILYYDPWFYKLKFPKDKLCVKIYKKKEFVKQIDLISKKNFLNKFKNYKKRKLEWEPSNFDPTNLLIKIIK